MLDTATKRRIDTARDILVGKVPDPKSQVEQITIALIYKFMDDMDAEAEELGGRRSFFAGEFGKYGWAKLMRSGLGGHETLGLYAEAITRMPENPGIPPLFRDIFKNAYLPYRDPETLRAFLKIIDEFEYDHSERLGDAFEYLLSVLGSQGDAGQFRTPRHIIDFIVDIVDPKKGDTILDPACGTAGFLISAWKHILDANRDAQGESTLTPDDRERLAAGIRGYDISPDMVRLSLANMYLHGFADPHIAEYDTLTSDERWNEFADVILANPPFMSPKGGIKPHNRFGVQSNRSEVLFVDYMAEHLTPSGRAGIIVPEGVIFQSGKSYKALRKMLVEKYLVAVISLPAGVFNPYSSVKTSILILDRAASKTSDTIGFFKVENDGFGLGAQRREIAGGELAAVLAEIVQYRSHSGEESWAGHFGQAVRKTEIAASRDYNLSGDRYGSRLERVTRYAILPLDEVITLDFGERITKRDDEGTIFPVYGGGGESFRTDRSNRRDDVVVSRFAMSPKCVRRVDGEFFLLDSGFTYRLREERAQSVLKTYVDELLLSSQDRIYACARGHAQKNIDTKAFRQINLPVPPLDMQREIVAEIEGYRRIVDGARAVVENYRPHVAIDPEWPTTALQNVAQSTQLGLTRNKAEQHPDYEHAYIKMNNISFDGTLDLSDLVRVQATERELETSSLRDGDFLYNTRNSPDLVGKSAVFHGRPNSYLFNNNILRIRFSAVANPDFVNAIMRGPYGLDRISRLVDATTSVAAIYQKNYLAIEVPLPDRQTQDQIVAELEAERALVEANRELIARMEKKIEAAIARVWGGAETVGPEQLAAE
jgi:type I restriction enzyme M protein